MALTDFIPGIGSAISAVSGIVSNAATNRANLQAVRETNKAQMDLAKYQADRNLDLWNLNNAYNTPSAQMERYKEAGLNPHLIYGNGSSSAGNSSSPAQGYEAPKLQAPHYDYSGIGSSISTSAQMALNGLATAATINKTNAETEAIHQNVENLKIDNQIKELMRIYQGYVNAKTKDEARVWFDLMNARVSEMDSRSVLNRASAQNLDTDRFTKDALRPLLVQEKKAQVNNIVTRTIGQKLDNQLNPLRREALIQQIAESVQRTKESNSRIGLIGSQTSESFTRTQNIALDNQLKSILRDYGLNLSNDELDRLEYQLQHLDYPLNSFRTAKYGARLAGAALGK